MKNLILSPLLALALAASAAAAPERQNAVVSEVLTGDSVRLRGGKILQYAALHAPPLQSVIPLVRRYGEDSLEYNRSLVEGKTVQIEWDAQIRDERGRLLGYVFLPDGTFVNLAVVREGHARSRATPPNLRYSENFRRAELDARRAKRGLWKEEPENPFIKNEYIGDKVTKIYYFPTSPELDRIPQAQLVTFRSRVDAKAAGYKACFDCDESRMDPTLAP